MRLAEKLDWKGLKRNERDMILNLYWYPCKLPVISVRF
jgi:hypothetical protein